MLKRVLGRKMQKTVVVGLVSAVLAGCVTTDRARFLPGPGQTQLTRDGRPAVSSVGKDTLVLLRTQGRDVVQRARVPFVVAIQNRSKEPITFNVRDVEVVQSFADQADRPIEVVTVEKLEQEERTRQVIGAILLVAAAGANAAAASRAGYYRSNTTIYTPRGTIQATTTGYSPGLAAAASANAAAQNSAMIGTAIEQGQENLARLERDYVKDHTMLPGEWYGGLMAIEPPVSGDGAETKNYQLRIRLGRDIHTFRIAQEPAQR